MKLLPSFLVLSLLWGGSVHAGETPITSRPSEITAEVLEASIGHIRGKLPEAALPERYSVTLYALRNGQRVEPPLLSRWTSPQTGDLVVETGVWEKRHHIMVRKGDAIVKLRIDGPEAVPFPPSNVVTKLVPNTPFLIAGAYRVEVKSDNVSDSISDIVAGIAMVIAPLPSSDSSTMSSPTHTDYRFHDLQPVIPVDDVDATVAYYRDKLGFTVDFVVGEPGIHARVSKDLVMIQFASKREDAGDLTDGTYIHLGHVDGRGDLDGLYKEYLEKGVKITMKPTVQIWGLREFEIEDLNGRRTRFAVDAPRK